MCEIFGRNEITYVSYYSITFKNHLEKQSMWVRYCWSLLFESPKLHLNEVKISPEMH